MPAASKKGPSAALQVSSSLVYFAESSIRRASDGGRMG